MKIRNIFISLIVMLLLVSCDLSANAKPTETPIPTITQMVLPTATNTPIPSETPLPSATPEPTATATPSVPIVFPKDININCRHGFGVEWGVVGSLLENDYAILSGRNLTSSWWYVTLNDGLETQCWVSADVTEVAGGLAGIPVVEQSKPFVTNVSIQPPEVALYPGCQGPVELLSVRGTIEMNGPGTVSWHIDSEQRGIISNQSVNFIEAGVKEVADSFLPSLVAGEYYVRLVVIGPNQIETQTTYKVECP